MCASYVNERFVIGVDVVLVVTTVRVLCGFFFEAEAGIRAQPRSRGLGDVYEGQGLARDDRAVRQLDGGGGHLGGLCLSYTSDAADEGLGVDRGGCTRSKHNSHTLPDTYTRMVVTVSYTNHTPPSPALCDRRIPRHPGPITLSV